MFENVKRELIWREKKVGKRLTEMRCPMRDHNFL